MRQTIAFASLLICAASFAPDAHTEIVGKTRTVKQTIGCPSYDDFKELLTLVMAGHEKQARDAAIRYNCVSFAEGEAVTILRERLIFVCVRPLDDSDCYWIRMDHLKRSD